MLMFCLPLFGGGGLVALLATILWIWMLVDCLQHETNQGNEKLIWTLVILLTAWIGALLYFLIRRPTRLARYGR